VNSIDNSRLLAELNTLSALAKNQSVSEASNQSDNFSTLFKEAINNVNAIQKSSSDMKTKLELGVPGIDLPEVMIASQKASIAFSATVQVRNKLLESYKDIMNMPV